jgi:hypothetical protein
MKNLILFPIGIFCLLIFISGCKDDDNYAAADHTIGMLSLRHWSGNVHGNMAIDTPIGGTTTKWPGAFLRLIPDTLFAVQKIDGFSVSILGATLKYISTDSTTTQTVNYAVTLPNSTITTLTYYYVKDSLVLDYHKLGEFHAPSGQNYYTDELLRTLHP